MKKFMKVLFSTVLLTCTLASCTTKEVASTPAPADPSATKAATTDTGTKSTKTITFGSHQSGLPSSGAVQTLALKFEEETGIKVDFQISPDSQWRDLLKIKLDSNEAPDIFCADADPLSLYSRVRPDENCIDLTNQEFVSRMADYVKPSISYKDKIYAITFPEKKTYVYVYNKKIFADLGLTIPKTYEEFKNVSQKILDSGVTPVFEATQSGWHQVLPLFESGPLYEKADPGLYEALNNNTKNIKDIEKLSTVIDQLNEFAKLGFYGPDYLSNSIEVAEEEFGTGKVAMVLQNPGWAMAEEAKYPDMKDNTGIFVMPFADNQMLGINPASNSYFANSKGKNQEEVLKFFEFLARPENLQFRLDNDTTALALCWPEIESKYPEEFDTYLKSLESGTVMQVGVKYIDPQWMEVGKDLEAMYAGSITKDEVLASISKRRDEQGKLQKDEFWK